jgi:hypothetical protein
MLLVFFKFAFSVSQILSHYGMAVVLMRYTSILDPSTYTTVVEFFPRRLTAR